MHFIVSSLCAWHDLHSFSLKKKKKILWVIMKFPYSNSHIVDWRNLIYIFIVCILPLLFDKLS